MLPFNCPCSTSATVAMARGLHSASGVAGRDELVGDVAVVDTGVRTRCCRWLTKRLNMPPPDLLPLLLRRRSCRLLTEALPMEAARGSRGSRATSTAPPPPPPAPLAGSFSRPWPWTRAADEPLLPARFWPCALPIALQLRAWPVSSCVTLACLACLRAAFSFGSAECCKRSLRKIN